MAAQKQQTTTTIHATGPNWTLKIILPVAGLIALVIFGTMFYSQVSIFIAGSMALFLAGGVIRGAFWTGHRIIDFLDRLADYQQKRLASKVHHTPSGLFYIPDSRVVFVPPTVSERKALGAGGVVIEHNSKPDLRRVLTQEQGAYSIIGAQRSGKSWQAMHIADYWLARGIVPIVYGYKIENSILDPVEWGGCKVLISDDQLKVEAALRKILQLGQMRKDGKAPKTPLPLFLDDWAWMVRNVPFSMDFIGEAGTVLTSTNIIPYFLVQSDTNGAFGTTKYGAMIKKNFTQLYVEPIPNAYGEIVPGHSAGYLVYPNKGKVSDRVDVDLIAGVPACVGKAPKFIDVAPVGPKLTNKQSEVKALYESGQTDRRKIMLEVYGESAGGKQWQVVNNVIDNHC